MTTHAGVAIILISEFGHAVGSYLWTAGSKLYLLGYNHPSRWLNWDDARAALLLPGPPHAPFWPYAVIAIVSAILGYYLFRYYLMIVRTANEQAWAWYGEYLHDIIKEVVEELWRKGERPEDPDDDDPDSDILSPAR